MLISRERDVTQYLEPDPQGLRRGPRGPEEGAGERIGAVGSDEGGLDGDFAGAEVAEEAQAGEEEGVGGKGEEAEEDREGEVGGEAGAACCGFGGLEEGF